MSLDGQDYEMMKSIRKAIREGDEITANLLRQMNERQLKAQQDQTAAFNRVAAALENLTTEVRALRQDMSPQLDKQKLPAPAPQPKK
ncbi:MAG: hypothetical protein PW788_05530 [Micavibrio sp.]|nr:hypothetical protein [Micavibrio sp.]